MPQDTIYVLVTERDMAYSVFSTVEDAKRFYLFRYARQPDAFDLTPSAVESRWRRQVVDATDGLEFYIMPAEHYASTADAVRGASMPLPTHGASCDSEETEAGNEEIE